MAMEMEMGISLLMLSRKQSESELYNCLDCKMIKSTDFCTDFNN